jgi:DNA modification methylase
MTISYGTFLSDKLHVQPSSGIDIDSTDINPILYPFQNVITQWALRKGRCAVFADCGMGKTFMQLEWARLTGEKTLIVAPLAVSSQTVREAAKIGIDVQYVRSQTEAQGNISITNFEMASRMDASAFGAVVLDESSILKNADGATRISLTEQFQNTPYKLCCTATPAPNDIAEFANHAEFLGVASRQEMLSMFFVHDDDGWRLKGHAREDFYKWMATWAVMVMKPSDIGFDDTNYNLPNLTVTPEIVNGDEEAIAHAQGRLFMPTLNGIQGRAAIRRSTLTARVDRTMEIINDMDGQIITWCGLNDEGTALYAACKDAVLVEGADSAESKAQKLTAFINGDVRVLITKPSIAGFGLNMQNCHNQIFVGINDSYEAFYQAVRRSWRYGQENDVDVRIVIADVECPILENVQRKETQAREVVKGMVNSMTEFQKAELGMVNAPRPEYRENIARGADWELRMGDCVERMRDLATDSVDLSVFSPPFLSLYVYSNSERDMGNSKTKDGFFDHFDYMLAELRRITKPGRLVACHVAQVPASKVHDGYIGIKDFRGGVIEAFMRQSFIYHGDVVIDKDPQAQAIRTHSKSLLFTQLKKDSSWLRPALADFILLFRNEGENETPIHPDIENNEWIEWARPIWYNIRESDTLNAAAGRHTDDERHIAPLQLGTIERCIRLWSNKGETVFSPFAGIGSEGWVALKTGRRFSGVELKDSYWNAAVKNLTKAAEQADQPRMALVD